MVLPVNKTSYFDGSNNAFPRAVRDAFLSANRDMDEANKCFAFGRYTACVFHLMRIMEVGLIAVGAPLSVDVKDNWGRALDKIEKQIEDRNEKFALNQMSPTEKSDWQSNRSFFSGAATHFHMVKDAWRNHTMHIVAHYDEDKARDIFNSISAFMRHLAEKLHE